MNRVVHFEIHAENPDKAVKFYSEVFGWKFYKWDGPMEYWMITTGEDDSPGINGGMMRREGPIDGEAVIAYVCVIEVKNIDEITSSVSANGGKIVVPKTAIPGIGWSVYCKDTEGNIFGMMEDDPEAA